MQQSSESREVVHRRIDELVSRVGHLETGNKGMSETDDVKRWNLMGSAPFGELV